MANNPNQLQTSQPLQQPMPILQKAQFPRGIIDPGMLAATPVQAKGDIYYSNGANFVRLAPGPSGAVLQLIDGVPTWVTPTGFSGTITTAKLTSGGTAGSMTFVNGVLTAQTPAT
jgi:hypothetical protein